MPELTVNSVKDFYRWSPAQAKTISALAESLNLDYVTEFEAWYEEDDASVGVSFVEDGLRQTGFFGRDGKLLGDWWV